PRGQGNSRGKSGIASRSLMTGPCLGSPSARDAIYEPRNRGQDGLRLVLVRRVPAVLELQELDVVHLRADPPHLLHRPVLVVLALDREHRPRDAWKVLLDVPRAEIGMKPDPVPA